MYYSLFSITEWQDNIELVRGALTGISKRPVR